MKHIHEGAERNTTVRVGASFRETEMDRSGNIMLWSSPANVRKVAINRIRGPQRTV